MGGAGFLRAYRQPALVIEDVRGHRVLHRERVRPGDRFALRYVHSSEHVPVRGTFRIEPDRTLTVAETAFAGFGPGLPELTARDAWRVEDGMFVVREPGTRLPALSVRVAPITAHRLETPAGRALDLSALMGGGGLVEVRVE